MQDDILSPREKFAAAQQIMSAVCPSLTSFYLMCNKREVSDITFRLNTRTGISPVIEYSNSFVDTISSKTLCILISIEMYRLILHHPTTRLLYPVETCYNASNIICTDESNIKNLPVSQEIKDMFPSISNIKKLDPEFNPKTDFFLEKIFNLLNRDKPDDKQPDIKMPDSRSGDTPSESDQDSQENKELESLRKHFAPSNVKKLIEKWGDNDILDTKIRNQVLREMENSTNWRKIPGELARHIKSANELRYDPRAIFAKFTRSVFSTVTSFTRMKRPRRAGDDYIGIIPGKRYEYKAKVLIALDSSGSMNDDDLMKGLSFVESGLRHAEIYYCWWDCLCTEPEKVRKPKVEYAGEGGGGTNPQCVIEKLENFKVKFDGIVFFTDCIFKWEEPSPKYKICIVRTDNSHEPPNWVKYSFKLKDLIRY